MGFRKTTLPHCVFSSQSVGWLWQVRLIDHPWLSGNDAQVGCPFLLVQSIGTYRHSNVHEREEKDIEDDFPHLDIGYGNSRLHAMICYVEPGD